MILKELESAFRSTHPRVRAQTVTHPCSGGVNLVPMPAAKRRAMLPHRDEA